MSMVQDIIDQQDREIERLRSRLAESEAENARLVAANKARDEFLRGHRYKHSEVDGYIDLCESQMATLTARLAEALQDRDAARAADSTPLDMVPAPDGSRVLCVADSAVEKP